MNITIIGTGYVGLVSGICFAEFGFNITCVDKEIKKIQKLQDGKIPIYEPGLEAILKRNIEANRITFTAELESGINVYGLDNLNDYYDPSLKKARLEILSKKGMPFSKIDLADADRIKILFDSYKPTIVINLAAQAGVRYSLENPHAYINSNIIGLLNVLVPLII